VLELGRRRHEPDVGAPGAELVSDGECGRQVPAGPPGGYQDACVGEG
jgi:hypothetical protein